MAHLLDGNDALANLAAEHTKPLLELAENGGGEAGQALRYYMFSADTSMGELELRLALGALAEAVLSLQERVARLEARQ